MQSGQVESAVAQAGDDSRAQLKKSIMVLDAIKHRCPEYLPFAISALSGERLPENREIARARRSCSLQVRVYVSDAWADRQEWEPLPDRAQVKRLIQNSMRQYSGATPTAYHISAPETSDFVSALAASIADDLRVGDFAGLDQAADDVATLALAWLETPPMLG